MIKACIERYKERERENRGRHMKRLCICMQAFILPLKADPLGNRDINDTMVHTVYVYYIDEFLCLICQVALSCHIGVLLMVEDNGDHCVKHHSKNSYQGDNIVTGKAIK